MTVAIDWVITGHGEAVVPRIWNFYGSREKAEADLAARSERIRASFGPNIVEVRIETYEEFKAFERKVILSGPALRITEEAYEEARDVLPPAWLRGHDLVGFNCIEHFSGPYTSQYVECDGAYFSRLVDAMDRSTWMTRLELEPLLAAEAPAAMP